MALMFGLVGLSPKKREYCLATDGGDVWFGWSGPNRREFCSATEMVVMFGPPDGRDVWATR